MLHEYQEIIPDIKVRNAHFAKIFEKQNDLNTQIAHIEAGREHKDKLTLENMKREKLKLKDEAHAIIMAYKQAQNL